MKFIVIDNPDPHVGGYVVRTDESPVYFECKTVFRNYWNAERYAKRLMANPNDKTPLNGWVLKSIE